MVTLAERLSRTSSIGSPAPIRASPGPPRKSAQTTNPMHLKTAGPIARTIQISRHPNLKLNLCAPSLTLSSRRCYFD